MTYRLTLTVPDADPIVEAGEAPSLDVTVSAKSLLRDLLARYADRVWTTVTLELTR